MRDGLLSQCRTAGCGWQCCNFGKDGYILLLPNEWEQSSGSKSHLVVLDEYYFGGKKVKCIAQDCASCDNGYKPIMCRTYPYWMRSVSKGIMVKSDKCCLKHVPVPTHRDYVENLFSDYALKNEGVERFLNSAHIDRYSVDGVWDKEPLSEQYMDKVIQIETAGFGDDASCFSSDISDIVKSIKSGCSSCVVSDGELLGYSLAYCDEYGVGYVEKCFVKEDIRGFGLQKELVKDNLKRLVTKGVSEVYSMCSPTNKASLKNFVSVGFRIMREIEFQGEKRLILKWSVYEGDNR